MQAPPLRSGPRGRLAILLATAADARAASVVVTVGDRSTTFTAAQLTAIADIAANDWQPGAAAERHPDAVALRRLIESSGGDAATVRSIAVRADGTAPIDLPGRQLEEPPPFGAGPPIPVLLWSDADGVHFARPIGRDLLDRVDVPIGAILTIAVTGGERLDVRVRASARRVEAGAPVTLTALAGDAAGDRVAYRWDLGDGRQGRGPQLQHSYGRPGRYSVSVTATAGSASGVSVPVEIAVGRAPAEPDPEPPAGSRGSGDAGGPSSPTGADGGDETAPGASGTPSGADGGGRGSNAPASPTATPAPPAAAPPPAAPATAPRLAPTRARQRRAASERVPSRPTVSGELLASTSPVPPMPAGAPADSVRAAAIGTGDGPLADVPWQALAVLALLSGGALIEWRCGRRGVKP